MPSRIMHSGVSVAGFEPCCRWRCARCARADAAVLVDDRPFDDAPVADADRRLASASVGRQLLGRFVVVGPHEHRVADRDVVADEAPQADHAVLDPRAFADQAAVGDQAVA